MFHYLTQGTYYPTLENMPNFSLEVAPPLVSYRRNLQVCLVTKHITHKSKNILVIAKYSLSTP